MISTNSIYTAFQQYKELGLDPLPIPYEDGHPTKGPKVAGWQTKAAKGEYTENDFAGQCNIGILLGGARNLTDIDCDSPEAVAVGDEIILHLGLRFISGDCADSRSCGRRDDRGISLCHSAW